MPSEEQIKHIRQVIAKDCTGQGYLYSSRTGEMCIVGGLLVEAGVDVKDLDYRGEPSPLHRGLLRRKFGLYINQVADLIDTNDSKATIIARRWALYKLLKNETFLANLGMYV